MMKLYDMAMALVKQEQKIVLKYKNGKVCFEGNAEQLLDFSEIDFRNITDVRIDNDVLKMSIE